MAFIDLVAIILLITYTAALPIIHSMLPTNYTHENIYSSVIILLDQPVCKYNATLYISDNIKSKYQINELNKSFKITKHIKIYNISMNTSFKRFDIIETPKWFRSDGQSMEEFMSIEDLAQRLKCKV